ncbi:hypothetical protein Tco_1472255, partial [Tanacetum coccineum]
VTDIAQTDKNKAKRTKSSTGIERSRKTKAKESNDWLMGRVQDPWAQDEWRRNQGLR